MYKMLRASHSGMAYLVLFLLLFAILFCLIKLVKNRPFDRSANVVTLIAMIAVHLQIAFGLVLYFVSPYGFQHFSGEAMKDTTARFFLVEHPTGMLLAFILVTLGRRLSKSTKRSDRNRYGKILTYYTIGFAILAYFVPWFMWF